MVYSKRERLIGQKKLGSCVIIVYYSSLEIIVFFIVFIRKIKMKECILIVLNWSEDEKSIQKNLRGCNLI